MSITEELRDYVADVFGVRNSAGIVVSGRYNTLYAIADRIDEAHEAALQEAYNHGEDAMSDTWHNMTDENLAEYDLVRLDAHEKEVAQSMDIALASLDLVSDETLAEHGLMRLPKDIDGEFIRLGDDVEILAECKNKRKHAKVGKIEFSPAGICDRPIWVSLYDALGCYEPCQLRHYKPTPAERIRKLADRLESPESETAAKRYAASLREIAGMNDSVNHPVHYSGNVECIDCIESALTEDEFRGFCKGNAMKYLFRERRKGHDEDLRKARWYLDALLGESAVLTDWFGENVEIMVGYDDNGRPTFASASEVARKFGCNERRPGE